MKWNKLTVRELTKEEQEEYAIYITLCGRGLLLILAKKY